MANIWDASDNHLLPYGSRWLIPQAPTHAQDTHLGLWLCLAEAASYWWLFMNFAVLVDPPVTVRTDERGRLNATDEPAVEYSDGWAVNALDGVTLPDAYWEPEGVSLEEIRNERDLEVRRLLIKRFGVDRYLRQTGGELIHQDDFGRLWAVGPTWQRITYVQVQDATPQPGGTRRDYWIQVPPNLRTAKAAVAWTFGQPEHEYQPVIES